MKLVITLFVTFSFSLIADAPDIHTKFLVAVKKGSVAEVESLLKQGAFVDSMDSDGWPAISLAVASAKKTDCKIVKALIAAGASNAIENGSDIFLLSRYFKNAPNCMLILLDNGYDLNTCIRFSENWTVPVFFDIVSTSESLNELKPFESRIDFSKLSADGQSVLTWISVNKNGLEFLQYAISKGAFVESHEREDNGQFCMVSTFYELRWFEYYLSIEPHLANIRCMHFGLEEYMPIESYIRNKKPKFLNEKLRLLKEAKVRAETVPLTYTAKWRESVPKCY
ncbi:ankyrin repeat domain-containing protein [Leptospira interrogans]|uniref:ankyrin repeat domain-containing protein n=1 Tax=Leptospira interrogans TaxID=173 RepID=UPI0002B96AE3|nr:ankyrin repeat domain-containing protein [Leptospira interrogans]QOI36787.1 ankyrin repeat domain-containing protein [Leptospira interrogans serovar Icterohaemorrhagiae]